MSSQADWDRTFLEMAQVVAKRSKDPSTKVGAVIADASHVIVSVGFNGPPAPMNDAIVPWHERPLKYSYVIHAEMNAILFGLASRGKLTDCTLYTTEFPCSKCVLFLAHSCVNIRDVVYAGNFSNICNQAEVDLAMELAYQMNITLRKPS